MNTEKNDNKQSQDIIDLRQLFKKAMIRKRLYLKTLSIAFIVSAAYILPVPRTYTCNVMLAPETENSSLGSGMLGSLASSFGFDLGSAMSSDAISPTLYPDLMESNDFIVSLFPIKVTTEDGELTTDYFDYLTNHQKMSFWKFPFVWLKNVIINLFKSEEPSGDGKIDPFKLTRDQDMILEMAKNNIVCNIDKRTDAITITVTDQDPLICATMADSVRCRLQSFITDYRTNKARIDYEFYKNLTAEAKADYEKVRRQYASFSDANNDIVLKSVQSKLTDMENDMQLKYNTYNAMNTQLQAARAKVQERTPAFTILQGASVPIKPTGPKRMIFVFAIMLFTAFGTTAYILKDDFK